MNHNLKFRRTVIIILIFLRCSWPNTLLAQDQSVIPSDIFSNQGENWVNELYDSLFQSDLELVNGRNHSARYPSGTGHPFFISRQSLPGNIIYKGKRYEYPYIRYDVLNDMVQLHHFTRSGSYIIDLNKTNVDGFQINGHSFVNIRNEEVADGNINPGFYELKHSGKYTFWLRWEKIYSDRTVETTGEYEDVKLRYIEVNNQWYRIVNRSLLLKAISDHQDEVKEFLRKSGISVRISSDEELLSVIKYCESLD